MGCPLTQMGMPPMWVLYYIIHVEDFCDSSKTRKYKITHTINCSTIGVIYYATCPCELLYIGLTSRKLKKRVREHALGIKAAALEDDLAKLKPIPRHFKAHHNCNPELLRVKGIDRVLQDKRGRDWKRILAQEEVKWIYTLQTMAPLGLNDALSFKPFLAI